MATAIEFALMSGASYISTRADINRFPVPKNWTEIIDKREDHPSGFEATVFQNGSETVISFAGTYPTSPIGAKGVSFAFNFRECAG